VAVLAQASASPPPLPQAVPAGSGRLTFWGFAVYDAQLWVTPGLPALDVRQPAAGAGAELPARLQGRRRRAPLAAGDAAGRPHRAAAAQRWEDELRSVLPDMQPGDRILGVHRPGAGAEFFVNGRRIGLLADPEFARRFFAIWLGPATSEPALRDALLAGTEP
jgi:hypothetical protein